MLLSQAIEFVKSVRTSWQPTAAGYGTMCINAQHVLNVLGDIDIKDIEPIHFIQLQKHFLAKGKATSTINRITSVLSTVLNECVKHRYLIQSVRFSILKEPKGRTKTYKAEQIQALLAAAKHPEFESEVFDILFLATKTGARRGELLSLQWNHINWDSNELIFFNTKNGDDRVLPMTPEIRGFIKRMYRHRICDGLVFQIHPDTLLRRLRVLQSMVGIDDKELCFHSLRHTVASALWEQGCSLPEVMELMGHRNPKTTMRYSHASTERMNKALALL